MSFRLLVFAFLSLAAWGQTVIRLPGPRPGDKVEPAPALPPPPTPAETAPAFTPLKLEWPAWLAVPGGNLNAQRTNPPGRMVTGSLNACPGDVVRQPSQGCLEKVFDSMETVEDLHDYLQDLLAAHGFTAEEDTAGPLKMREYPEPQSENYYRQIEVFLRPLITTRRTRVEINFLVRNGK